MILKDCLVARYNLAHEKEQAERDGFEVITVWHSPTDRVDDEKTKACNMILEALGLRKKYLYSPRIAPWLAPNADQPLDPWTDDGITSVSSHVWTLSNGVYHVYESKEGMVNVASLVSLYVYD